MRIGDWQGNKDKRFLYIRRQNDIMDAYVAMAIDGIELLFVMYVNNTVIGFIMLTYGVKKDNNIPELA